MPIVTIHEEVAINIANKIPSLNTKEYYLGAYAPDSVNLLGFASKEARWTAHQRKKDLHDWRNSLEEFYNKEKNNYPKNFILGYVTHILTDIIFDDYFYDDITKEILKNNIQKEDTHNMMGKDMGYYSNKSKYKDQIIELIKNQTTYYDILNITKEEMKQFGNKVINTIFEDNDNKYITEELVKELSKKVLLELNKYLED